MNTLFQNILTASFHGSIVILAVMLLRLVLKKTPRKYICLLWLLAGLRLLMPFQIQSDLSLQPSADPVAQVQQQISGNLEMIIGASVDPALGHSILTGLGGTLVEILKDVSFGHVPLSSQDPGRMLRSLRSYRLLEGYRGSAKANIEQFRQILMQVNQLLLDFPAICEMDMNPLIFDETRGAFYAVDARIKIS